MIFVVLLRDCSALASLAKLESPPEHDFIMEKMVEQAYEIDHVVKQINVELTVAEAVVHN